MDAKNFWESKTFWAGVIQILIATLGLVADFLGKGDFSTSAYILLATGVLTIVLRFLTDQPIKQGMKKVVVPVVEKTE